MSKRKARDLSGRVESVEVLGGKLVLRGKCVGYRNDVTMSIHPEDVTLVSVALAEFTAGNLSYQAARQTRAAQALAAKQARAAERAARKALRTANTVHGIRIVTAKEEDE